MSKVISRRLAAFCAVVAAAGIAGLGSAQAASPAPAKVGAVVRLTASTGPVVKLGPALLEERTITPGGLVVVHETVCGSVQSVQAVAAPATGSQPSGRKA